MNSNITRFFCCKFRLNWSDDGGKELFVHHTDIQMEGFKDLSDGQAVEYEVGEGKKGPCAQMVKPL
ncbi:MAG: cold-shock protein [Planctomycetota bacterium]